MLDSKTQPVGREEAPPRPRRRGRRLLLGGTAVLAIGAAGAVVLMRGGSAEPAGGAASALPTAAVQRTDMVQTTTADGTLGYAGSYKVLADGKGRITWLPGTGSVIERGERVFGLNGEGVPLLYGDTPFWRELRQGVSNGKDVRVLERNLDALGYGGGLTVDRDFTWVTARAIRNWQDDRNVPRTGTVGPGDVVVQPGALRVSKVEAILGARAGGTVLTATGSERQITVDLPVSERDVAKESARVRVTLPGGKKVGGKVSSIGTVATAGSTTSSTSQTGQGTETATVPVRIELDESGEGTDLDGAPVTVGFASTEHKNVLVVPINALLASADGAYSVNAVAADGTVRSVPVKLGIFDGERVEVTGDLKAGTKVQVPES